MGIALLGLPMLAGALPASAQQEPSCGLSLMLNEALEGDPVISSIIESGVKLVNTSNRSLEVMDASPNGDDITGIDYYPSCGNSTDTTPPTPCDLDPGPGNILPAAVVLPPGQTTLEVDANGAADGVVPLCDIDSAFGTVLIPCYTTCASPVQVNSLDLDGNNVVGDKVELVFTDGLTLPPSDGQPGGPDECEIVFPTQVQGFGSMGEDSPPNVIVQQANTAGSCVPIGGDPPLPASGSGSAFFVLSNVTAEVEAEMLCDELQPDFTYQLTVTNPVDPALLPPEIEAGTLVGCSVDSTDPLVMVSCDPLDPILPLGAQTVGCTSSSPGVAVVVTCGIESSLGEPQAGVVGATADAECAECDIQLDRQVSCDGGTTWVDAGPGGSASFDDEPIVGICSTSNLGPVVVRWVAVNNSFIGNQLAEVQCNLVDGNPNFADDVEMALMPPGSVDLGGPGPGVIAMTEINQCIAVVDDEPNTAVLSCECVDEQNEIFGSDEDTDTAGFMCEPPVVDVEIAKECVDQSPDGTFNYTIQVSNPTTSDSALGNCEIDDPDSSCDGVTAPLLLPGEATGLIACSSPSPTNTATVTCNVLDANLDPTGETTSDEDSAECCVAQIDKQVSCDGGQTWTDTGFGDPDGAAGIFGCTAWRTGDPEVKFRYFAQSSHNASCTLTDSNGVITVPAGGFDVPAGGPTFLFETSLIECNENQTGWMEPNTAMLSCTCEDPQGEPAGSSTDTDTANVECRTPDLTVVKECSAGVDPTTNDWLYDITITNDGDAPLENCRAVDATAPDCDRTFATLAPDQTESWSCSSLYKRNRVTVTCDIVGADKSITRSDDAECTPELEVDKQVSCDGGSTWHDVGFGDNLTLGCTGLAGQDQVKVRYFARTKGSLQNCVLTDTNTVFIPAGGVPIAHSSELDGMIHETDLVECDESQEGWMEPDTATLTCDCLSDPQLPPEPIEDSDTANIDCETCEVKVDKQISCSSGFDFSDVGYDDGVEESCVGWLGQDEIVYRFEVENTGTLPVASCTLVDTNETVGAMGVIPIADALAPGETDFFENPLLECGEALAGGEPDTATYTCSCVGFEDRSRVSNSDSADLECRTADLAVTKTCDPQVGGESHVTITYENVGDANLVNCVVEDEIFLDDPECPADVGNPSPIPVNPASGIDLGPGQLGTSTGVVFDLADHACNRATVRCEIEGSLDESGQVKTITGTADDLCAPQGEGCYSRTPGFWGTHPRVTEIFLPVSSCGLVIDNVDAATPGSAIEDLCWGGQDFQANNTSPQQLQLIRQCSAAALNFAVTQQAGGDCESEFPGITQAYQECCASLCNGAATGSAISSSGCLETIDAFNNSVDSLFCDDGPNSLPYPFCPGLGANGFQGEPAICSEANGNGFVNPGRNLGSRVRRGLR